MNILVTGGAGYLGSHTVLELLQQGADVTVIDNLSNSSPAALDRVSELGGGPVDFVRGDICVYDELLDIFRHKTYDAVIHFAGLKAVGESNEKPVHYYQTNVSGTLTLLQAMQAAGCKTLIFSSSATVYGTPKEVPIPESAARQATNPYGRSKLMVEDILADVHAADPSWRIARLRYFNPIGAHPSGMIGEDPLGIPNNLMPYITQVACGRREKLSVFGSDYSTLDGTGVRDYIHVQDLALGHLAALSYLQSQSSGSLLTVNLGTGKGVSVLEMVQVFQEVTGQAIPYEIVGRRDGDVAICFADSSLAERLLGWKAERDLADMCRDAWRWQSQNRLGYTATV